MASNNKLNLICYKRWAWKCAPQLKDRAATFIKTSTVIRKRERERERERERDCKSNKND